MGLVKCPDCTATVGQMKQVKVVYVCHEHLLLRPLIEYPEVGVVALGGKGLLHWRGEWQYHLEGYSGRLIPINSRVRVLELQ